MAELTLRRLRRQPPQSPFPEPVRLLLLDLDSVSGAAHEVAPKLDALLRCSPAAQVFAAGLASSVARLGPVVVSRGGMVMTAPKVDNSADLVLIGAALAMTTEATGAVTFMIATCDGIFAGLGLRGRVEHVAMGGQVSRQLAAVAAFTHQLRRRRDGTFACAHSPTQTQVDPVPQLPPALVTPTGRSA